MSLPGTTLLTTLQLRKRLVSVHFSPYQQRALMRPCQHLQGGSIVGADLLREVDVEADDQLSGRCGVLEEQN